VKIRPRNRLIHHDWHVRSVGNVDALSDHVYVDGFAPDILQDYAMREIIKIPPQSPTNVLRNDPNSSTRFLGTYAMGPDDYNECLSLSGRRRQHQAHAHPSYCPRLAPSLTLGAVLGSARAAGAGSSM